MKFKFVSDVHLEHPGQGYLMPPMMENEDFFIIAGDLSTHVDRSLAIEYMEKYLKYGGKKVVYILGNHDYYGSSIEDVNKYWEEFKGYNDKIMVVDHRAKYIEIDQYLVVFATLWCDITEAPDWMLSYMRDFDMIYNFTKDYEITLHKDSLRSIQEIIDNNPDKKVIVITHHAPIKNGSLKYSNIFFYNSLHKFIELNNNIVTWYHGHTHEETSFKYHNTTIKSFINGEIQLEDYH